jgi:hypothetical protein
MAVTISGTIKSGGAFSYKGKQGPQVLVSFNVVDEVGNMYACQMWPDDEQHPHLAQVFSQGGFQRHPVQCTVAGYTVRMRKFKDGTERPQANFVVTQVQIS